MKFRIWWIPQVGIGNTFYIPVDSILEGAKVIEILIKYDQFQFDNKVKPDYCNVGGLQYYDEKTEEWSDFEDYFEEDGNELFYKDPDDYVVNSMRVSDQDKNSYIEFKNRLTDWYERSN